MPIKAPDAAPFLFSFADLRRAFPPGVFDNGLIYARQGRVLRIGPGDDQDEIQAHTRGSRATPYRQSIRRTLARTGHLPFIGRCTGPVGWNCKHVAAVMAALAQDFGVADRATSRPATPAASASVATRTGPAAPTTDLPPIVAAWLRELPSSADAGCRPQSEKRERLVYILEPRSPQRGARELAVTAHTQSIRQGGAAGALRAYQPHRVETPAGHLTPADRIILRRLARLGKRQGGLADDDDPPELIERILGTGRAHWIAPDAPPLRPGQPRPGRLTWELTAEGAQIPAVLVDAGGIGLSVPGAWYVDPATAETGPVTTGDVPPALAARLLAAPAIPPEAAAAVGAELRRRLPSLPPPMQVEVPEIIAGPPVRRLTLTTSGDTKWDGPQPVARLHFGYGPFDLPPGAASVSRRMSHAGRVHDVRRDVSSERDAFARLLREGLAPLPDGALAEPGGFVLARGRDDAGWLDVVLDVLPDLASEGWEVAVAPDFPVQLVRPDGGVDARLREGSGIDWFELDLGVTVDGARVDLVPALVEIILRGGGRDAIDLQAEDEPILVPLPDGRLLQLPAERLRPTLLMLVDLFAEGRIGAGDGTLRFTSQDAAELVALEEASGLAWQGAERLRALGRQLRAAAGGISSAEVPASFCGKLRPYQAEGVAWMQFLRDAGLGGVLADDMGLGKTVQTLAHLAIEQAAGRLDRPVLLVCPTSLVPNWLREAGRFAPGLRVLPLHGRQRKERFGEIAEPGPYRTARTPYLREVLDALSPAHPARRVVFMKWAQVGAEARRAATRRSASCRARRRSSAASMSLRIAAAAPLAAPANRRRGSESPDAARRH
jgi:hypothetical protein